MDARERRLLSILALLVGLVPPLVGCASDPDVVATRSPQRRDGGLSGVKELNLCRAGRYGGNFSSIPAADGAVSSLKGPISFELMEEPSGEFFRVTHGDKLEGSSEQGDKFSADIDADSTGCREGHFEITLANGLYTLAGTTIQVAFQGNVTGTYVVSDGQEAFFGSWSATFLNNQRVQGPWTAVWFGPN